MEHHVLGANEKVGAVDRKTTSLVYEEDEWEEEERIIALV